MDRRMRPSATLLARCSEIVYAKDGESTSKWRRRVMRDMETLNVMPIAVIDRADVQCCVGLYYQNRITCFRGTDSYSEAVTNFFPRRRGIPVCPGVKVHRRFVIDVEVAMQTLEVDYLDGRFTDWFTGHSRGGAEAAIMASLVHHQKFLTSAKLPRTHLVTHETPRSGNWKFAKYLSQIPHVRWQRAGDIVPLLPPPPLFWHDRPPELFDSYGILRPEAGVLTRMFQWPAAVKKVAHQHGIACIGLHEMKALRKLIEKEERDSPTGNLFDFLLR